MKVEIGSSSHHLNPLLRKTDIFKASFIERFPGWCESYSPNHIIIEFAEIHVIPPKNRGCTWPNMPFDGNVLKDSGPPILSFWGTTENKEVALPPARFQVRFRLQKWAFQKKTRCQVNDLFFFSLSLSSRYGTAFLSERVFTCVAHCTHSAKARVKRHAEWN